MAECICPTAPAPFDHLQEVSRGCIAHLLDVQLVAAGWSRNGPMWTKEGFGGLFTRDQALEAEEKERNNGIPKD